MINPAICIALLLVMNLFWAGSYAVVKVGLDSLDPVVLVFFRLVLALLVMIGWLAVRRVPLRVGRGDAARIIGAGLLLAVSNVLWVAGIGLSQATDASLLYVFEPVWGIILATIFLKEKLRMTAVLGLLLAMAGLLRLSGFDLFQGGFFSTGQGMGNALVVIGLLAESFFSILLKPVSQRCSAPMVTAGVLAVAVASLAVPAGMRGAFATPVTAGGIASILYLSLVCTVVGYTLWIAVMKHVPVGVMLFTVFLQPLIGPVIAAVTLGESIDARVIGGGALLIAGMTAAVAGHIRSSRRERITICPDTVTAAADI